MLDASLNLDRCCSGTGSQNQMELIAHGDCVRACTWESLTPWSHNSKCRYCGGYVLLWSNPLHHVSCACLWTLKGGTRCYRLSTRAIRARIWVDGLLVLAICAAGIDASCDLFLKRSTYVRSALLLPVGHQAPVESVVRASCHPFDSALATRG